MKHYILQISVAAGLLVGITSCSDFLDVKPEGQGNATNYFQNDFQASEAIEGAYALLDEEDFYGQAFFFEQAGANDIVWGRSNDFHTLATLRYNGNESCLRDVMDKIHTSMARSNWIVAQLLRKQSQKELSTIEKRSLGEAYFLRGFMHFLTAYRYGSDKQGVPFDKYEDFPEGLNPNIPKQRATVMDNYKLIEDDLLNARKYLPRFETYGVEDKGRPSRFAAVGLLAKVYAYWATFDPTKWDKVIELVYDLENKYDRGLAENFADNFTSDYSKWWNREYIYSLPSIATGDGGGPKFPGVILENKGWGKYNGWGYFKPTLDIYEEMLKDGAGNIRLTRSILEYGQEFPYFGEKMRFYSTSDFESGFMINKYMEPFGHPKATEEGYVNPNGNSPTVRINFPILRFADLLLLRAEGYLMKGNGTKAAEDINHLRKRAKVTPISGAATARDLYHERRVELAFEYTDHLYDLKRWHYQKGNAELRQIASDELNARPRVRYYEDRSQVDSPFTVGFYKDYPNKNSYQDYMIAFPWPSKEILTSKGKLKQNPGY